MSFCISSLIIWKHFSSYGLMRGLILFITNLNNSSGCYARKVVVWLFLREEVCWKSYWFHQTKLDRRAVLISSFSSILCFVGNTLSSFYFSYVVFVHQFCLKTIGTSLKITEVFRTLSTMWNGAFCAGS